MKNTRLIALLIASSVVSVASAYYDTYGNWHDDVVTEALDTVTGGRYSDTPEDRKERVDAQRKLEDKRMSANEKKAKAQKQYQDKQEKIRRKKEDRRLQK